MSESICKAALELIAQLAPDAKFFWIDKSGRNRDQMSAADLARAVLAGQVALSEVSQDRRGLLR